MAIKLNSNALVNQSIEEEKLSEEVQEKLNKSVSNLPKLIFDKDISVTTKIYAINNKTRKEIITEKTRIDTYTESGTYELPENVTKIQLFMVNGGNGGSAGTSSQKEGFGGTGGYTKELELNESANSIQIIIGDAGAANAGKGGTTSVVYNETAYSCDAQGNNSQTGQGADGVIAPDWTEKTELFGANGGGGSSSSSSNKGGNTGGANGATSNDNAEASSFYGAGGGGGYYVLFSSKTPSAGYQGIVIAKITYNDISYEPIDSTEVKGIVCVTKNQWDILINGGAITNGEITHTYDKDYLYYVEMTSPSPTPEEPFILEITAVGSNNVTVPEGYTKCEAFLVNGGNSGAGAWIDSELSLTGNGGGGGYSAVVTFPVNSGDSMIVYIGNGGHLAISHNTNLGGNTYITYNGNTFIPKTQNRENDSNDNGQDGVLNPLNESDTNLYGAGGGSGRGTSEQFKKVGGKTGGGDGGYSSSWDDECDGIPGSFYGAGGGGACSTSDVKTSTGGAGYQGYAYLKFT